MIIAGPDEGGYRAAIEGMIRELDLSSNVTLTGSVTGGTKSALLRGADLFVLPSYSEGVPVAVIEAMAYCVPAVVTHESNIPELESEGGGWLCEARLESVVQTLQTAIASSKNELKQRGLAARKLVELRYSWPGIAAEIRDACDRYCR